MKAKMGLLLFSILLLIATLIYKQYIDLKPATVFRRGSTIGNLNLSGKRWHEGYDLLFSKINSPFYINFENKSQATTLADMGVSINRDKLTKLTKTCRFNSLRFLCRNTTNEKVDPKETITIDNQKLQEYLSNLESEIKFLATNTIISFDDYSFRIPSEEANILLDKSNFEDKKKLIDMVTSLNSRVTFKPIILDNKEQQKLATEKLISNMSYPLLIKYGRNPIHIPATQISDFIMKETKEDGFLYGIVNAQKVSDYLRKLKEAYGSQDIVVVHDRAVEAVQRALLYRATDYQINNAVVLPLEGNPKTNGELHDVYLELIKSQQRLYRFEQGKLTKTYIVSTGLTWETPSGRFEILGKTRLTISYSGNWYMPYYLPIGTISGYRFGFHEIPYHLDAAGNIYARDISTMGSPATGGCIQLNKNDAVELFEWVKIGVPVYIHE